MSTDLDRAKYVSFTTYRKDGTAVSVPVWLVPYEGGYAFTTEADSGKVKRLGNNPDATLQLCGARGKVRSGAVVHRGRAEVLDGDRALVVLDTVKRKYRVGYAYLVVTRLWLDRHHRGQPRVTTAVKFTPAEG